MLASVQSDGAAAGGLLARGIIVTVLAYDED